jgi:hypothetical protein
MATLDEIVSNIQDILQDPAYADNKIVDKINLSLQGIAAGIRMPDGSISPPLSDLYDIGTVNSSITLPYVLLPSDYQRNVFNVYDSAFTKIPGPRGGDYYAFTRFMKQVNNLSLAETGEIYMVCVKGSKLYYQGIPSASTVIGLHFYRRPLTLALDGDIPEGIPDHLQLSLLTHRVLMSIFGEKIEDGQDNSGIGTKYHTSKFYEYMIQLCDFIGVDSEPQYYGEDSDYDAGRCDG